MKNIAILGSTGSIGTQTLEVADENPDICIKALAAGRNVDLMEKQVRKYHPCLVSMESEKEASDLRARIADTDTRVESGMDGLIDVSTINDAEMLVTGIVGMIGIKPTKNENWSHLGRNFAIIISTVTAVVIYFQLIKNNGVSIENILKVLPFSLIFALFNSFVEETITRLGVVVVLKNVLKDKTIALLSAMIFGTVHYWGNPGGIAGVLLAGFLGWLLAKSILEIKGIFWAWFIHFLQDVIIFSALLTAM